MNLELHKPTDELIREFAHALRPIDRLEISLLTEAGPPYPALLDSVAHSGEDAWAVTDDGLPLCILGVAPHPHLPGYGVPWLMATPLIEDYKTVLIEEGRKIVEGFHAKYPSLANIVYQHNRESIVLLKRLGFDFISLTNVGSLNAPFYTFVKHV